LLCTLCYPRGMNLQEYENLKRQAREEYRRKLDAIEIVWAMSQDRSWRQPSLSTARQARNRMVHQSPSDSPEAQVPPETPSNGTIPGSYRRFSVIREIRDALPDLGGDITQGQVRQKLAEKFPDQVARIQPASVSSALRRLLEAGELELVSEGSGSDPNVYRRVE